MSGKGLPDFLDSDLSTASRTKSKPLAWHPRLIEMRPLLISPVSTGPEALFATVAECCFYFPLLHMQVLLLLPNFSRNSYASCKTQLLSLLLGCLLSRLLPLSPTGCSTDLELKPTVFVCIIS